MIYAKAVADLNYHAMGDQSEWDEHGRKVFDLAEAADAKFSGVADAKKFIEEAGKRLDVEGDELHDCDALLVRMQDAEIKLTLALNYLDRALAGQSPSQQK